MTTDQSQAALLRALAPHVGPCRMLSAQSRDWASALFVGARHRLALALEGEDGTPRAERLAAKLEECELAMRGGFVADLQAIARIENGQAVLGIEALTIEEPEAEAIRPGLRRAG
jgi:hypothetical protein